MYLIRDVADVPERNGARFGACALPFRAGGTVRARLDTANRMTLSDREVVGARAPSRYGQGGCVVAYGSQLSHYNGLRDPLYLAG